jgi:hypothetical protein
MCLRDAAALRLGYPEMAKLQAAALRLGKFSSCPTTPICAEGATSQSPGLDALSASYPG